jgi:hypothetical protein
MPGKMARSGPDHLSGCPMCWWRSSPRGCLAGRPEKREYSWQIGSHPGNPGSNYLRRNAWVVDSKVPKVKQRSAKVSSDTETTTVGNKHGRELGR